MRKKVVLLGSTGSVGQNACKVLGFHKDKYEVKALSANVNYKMLLHQAERLSASEAIIVHDDFYERAVKSAPENIRVSSGVDAMIEAVSAPDVDIVVCAILGVEAVFVVLKALQCGKTVALASKEIMLTAGNLVMGTVRKSKGRIIPVDSEHSAIFQCLQTHDNRDVKSLVLTCSGGPFRGFDLKSLLQVSLADALRHPVWSMGRKISIDSATLMNKALEVVEAVHLFNVPHEMVKVVVHPEGIIHSLVEFEDNSMVGLFSNPSMELPLQYALSYPDVLQSEVKPLDLTQIGSLSFSAVDDSVFPSLRIAREALDVGKNMPLVMNAANDIAVRKFCDNEITFTDIWKVIERTMEQTEIVSVDNIEDIMEADAAARRLAESVKI